MIEEIEGFGAELQINASQSKSVFFTSDAFTF